MLILSCLGVQEFSAQPASWKQTVLGGICFKPAPENMFTGITQVVVNTPPLNVPADQCELWRTSEPVSSGVDGRVRFSMTRELLFGSIVMPESGPEIIQGSNPLQRATHVAVRDIFRVLDQHKFPHLLRVWNYFPDINLETAQLERYRQFNIGRQEGFEACGRSLTGNVPAACALGTMAGPLVMYFFAVRTAPLVIENPRQVSAYHYSQHYGPRSPTFSRAVVSSAGEQELLFVSGTASIVGDRTVHPGDVTAQTRESLANIETVITAANRVVKRSPFTMESLHYKVYVRNANNLEQVRVEVRRAVGSSAHVTFLQADICRSDLLVEVEASAGHGLEAG